MKNNLKIGNLELETGVIRIQPILNTNLVEEDSRAHFFIYEEGVEDFEFDFNFIYLKLPKGILMQNEYIGDFEIEEEALDESKVIWYQGDEHKVQKLKLYFHPNKKDIIGTGTVVSIFENQVLNFEFSGEYLIKELAIWEFSEKEKIENQVNNPNQIIEALELLLRKFHISSVFFKWENSYKPKMKWFDEFYTKTEKKKLVTFDNFLKNINQTYEDDSRDYRKIFDSEEWEIIVNKTETLLNEIKTEWNKV